MIEVGSFLGFESCYRRMIPILFSKVAKPFKQLLQNLEGTSNQKKKFVVHWGQKLQDTFETLQKFCSKSLILVYAEFEYPFIINTDASGEGLRVVLYQIQERKKRVIAYDSRSPSGSERNYPIYKMQFLALRWAIIEKFHE